LASLEKWNLAPSLVAAAEAVEAAILAGKEADAVSAALYLLADTSTAAPLLKAQAAALLNRAGREGDVPEQIRFVARSANNVRQAIRLHPRDALAWVELAYAQTIAGHPRSANHSMMVALKLEPHNRHVLRSASRLFLHLGEREQAHDLLAKNRATPNDPWLLAAEIALAGVAERDPKFFKPGTRMLDSGSFSPHHLTELAGATGTVELLDGSRKKAKKMFVQSVVSPTGSSLAQAEWATPSLGSEVIDRKAILTATEPFEAEAYHLYREGRFAEAAQACEKWARVEAFSIRPFEFGSIAAGHADDFATAIALADEGMRRRPSHLLINSLAYALASSGDPTRAAEELAKIKPQQAEPKMQNLTVANQALVAFRNGQPDVGVALYRAAIDGFMKNGLKHSASFAKAYLAREAVLAGIPEAKTLLKEAQDALRPYPATEAARVLRKVEIAAGEKPRDVPDHIAPPEVSSNDRPQPLPKKEIRWVTPGWEGLPSRNS
jgi:hypothetical protein